MKTDDFYFYLSGHEGYTVKDHIDSNYGGNGDNHSESSSQHESKYQCLLKCEGGKTYHNPGYCPDCNTKLALVVRNNNQL